MKTVVIKELDDIKVEDAFELNTFLTKFLYKEWI